MTKLFLCWTNRDPEFQGLFPGCGIMVSPGMVTNSWSVSQWETMPGSLMLDSGAYSPGGASSSVSTCLEAQSRMLEGWPSDREAFLIHYDKPLRPGIPFEEYQARVTENIENAKAYIDAFPAKRNLFPVAVIHALDEETLAASYLEMRGMGYRRFAIGSLVSLSSGSRTKLDDLLKACRDIKIENLHVLGISSPLFLTEEVRGSVASFDTSSHIRNAIAGTVLYSAPYGRFVIRPNERQKVGMRSFTFRTALPAPRHCACPPCSSSPDSLSGPDERTAKRMRKIHNAHHLIQEVQSWNASPT